MRKTKFAVSVAVCAALAVALATESTIAAAEKSFGSLAVPAGITFTPLEVQGRMRGGAYGRGGGGHSGVLSNAVDMTLYTYEADTPCVGVCLADWKPLVAPDRVVETAEWTVVRQSDGANQWAYYGKLLFTSTKDEKSGDMNGAVDGGAWHIAKYKLPDGAFLAPSGISVRTSARAKGDVLVNHLNMTLYYLTDPKSEVCTDTCLESWTPLIAGELAGPFGDWTVVTRSDGFRQWAYRGRPLYAFSGDERPGDAAGLHFDNRWRTAAVREYFTPEDVQMRKMSRLSFFTTDEGQTLYARDRYQYTAGSFHADGGSTAKVSVGREIGTDACGGPCSDGWVPLAASPPDQPSGYWSILTRDDGTQQWAYQGYALYTNAADKKPGDMFGRDVFEFTDGSHALYWRVAVP